MFTLIRTLNNGTTTHPRSEEFAKNEKENAVAARRCCSSSDSVKPLVQPNL